MKKFFALIATLAALGAQLVFAGNANAASPCSQLTSDIQSAVNASSAYGSTVPSLCTTDCPSLYNYYVNLPAVPNHDSLASRLMDIYAACNVSKVPSSGLPSSGTTNTPTHMTIKCPKINKDMHGRKDFAGTTCLAGKVLAGFNLSGMDLTGASLRSTNLTSANLTGTKLVRADLTKAIFDYSNVQGVDFTSATMNDLRASHLDGSPKYIPYNWKLVKGFLFGPHADLSKVFLKGLTLDNIDLSYANLSGTVLDGAKLSNVNVSQTKFTPSLVGTTTRGITGRPSTWDVLIVNGFLIAEGVNLSGVNLSFANLSSKTVKNLNLAGANLANANLSNTKFVGVNLKGAKLDGAKLDRAVFDKCDLSNASMQRSSAQEASFASAKLGQVDFSNTSLRGSNFSYADIYAIRIGNTDLTNVRMDGVHSNTYVSGIPKALPTGWVIVNSFLKKP
jgi:uncharacterized protein YjbI with pentapeptide repeats